MSIYNATVRAFVSLLVSSKDKLRIAFGTNSFGHVRNGEDGGKGFSCQGNWQPPFPPTPFALRASVRSPLLPPLPSSSLRPRSLIWLFSFSLRRRGCSARPSRVLFLRRFLSATSGRNCRATGFSGERDRCLTVRGSVYGPERIVSRTQRTPSGEPRAQPWAELRRAA